MASRPRIVIATPHPNECTAAADWLQAEGFEPVKATTLSRAAQEIKERTFDLVLADFDFAFRGGLQALSRERVRNPKAPSVVIGPADAASQALAVRRDAMYLTRPVDQTGLVCMVQMAVMESRPERRSMRKPVNRFDAIVGGVPSHIVDVSNEGLRLEIPRSHAAPPPRERALGRLQYAGLSRKRVLDADDAPRGGSLRGTHPGHVTPMPPASSREMACSAFPTRTVSGPPNGSAERSFTFLPGTSASLAR